MMRYILCVGALSGLFTTIDAVAEVITVGAVKDNTLYESATGALSNGAGSFLFVGRSAQASNSRRRGLIAFDIAGNIPAGSTVGNVQLRLNMSRTRFATARTIEMHRALADWGESTSNATGQEGSGALAAPGDATWIHTFSNTDFWTSIGGDFSTTVSASRLVGGIGAYTFGSTAPMMADVQSWLDDPTNNFGWVLTGVENASTTAKRFDTREHFAPANRPELTIEFTPPLVLGACCDDANGICTDDRTIDECSSAGFRFGGVASTCATIDPPCIIPVGACCNDGTGECLDDMEEIQCETSGGRYGGAGSDCASLDPPCRPHGACCNPTDDSCNDGVLREDCAAQGSRYGGDASTCATIDPPCVSIPTLSQWGIITMTLCLLAAARIYFRREAAEEEKVAN